MMDPGSIGDILSRLGPVKNPVLVTSYSFSTVTMWRGDLLVRETQFIQELSGMMLLLLSVVVFLCGTGFYAYAFLRLPSTSLEKVFLQEGKSSIERNGVNGRRRRRQPTKVDPEERGDKE